MSQNARVCYKRNLCREMAAQACYKPNVFDLLPNGDDSYTSNYEYCWAKYSLFEALDPLGFETGRTASICVAKVWNLECNGASMMCGPKGPCAAPMYKDEDSEKDGVKTSRRYPRVNMCRF